jgi:hypothetical protein
LLPVSVVGGGGSPALPKVASSTAVSICVIASCACTARVSKNPSASTSSPSTRVTNGPGAASVAMAVVNQP